MFYKIRQFYDKYIEVTICENLSQKTFTFSGKPCSVIFVRRL